LQHLNKFLLELLNGLPFPVKGNSKILEFLRWKERRYHFAPKGKRILI
jgi:hypothetical protein